MPDPINEVRRPAVSWQDFSDVVNSGIVADDAKLDLIKDLYSNTTISHTGVWGRGWRMSKSDKARCLEIRSALADAIRFKANVGFGKTTGNATLDAILRRIEETQKPLTKREVRQVLNEVGKIVDIMSARRVLTVSINKASDICRPGGQARKLERGIVALRQKVMEAKNLHIQDNDALLVMINELQVKQDKVIRGFASLCGSANKHLLAPADNEAEYIDKCKTASKDLLDRAKNFDELEGEYKKVRELVRERFEKVVLESQIAALERFAAREKEINHRKSQSGDGNAFDSTLDSVERTLKSARQQLEGINYKLAAEAKDLLREKVVKTEVKGKDENEGKDEVKVKGKVKEPENKEEVKKPVEQPKIKEQPKPVEQPKQQVVQKQVNPQPKNELPKNNLDKFLSNNGVFKEEVLPKFTCNHVYGSKAYNDALKEHNEGIDTKLREQILPNWKTLTSRLDALRQEAMTALGVDPKLKDWFIRWHPEFDWKSKSFIDKVRGEKIGGKNVKEVEDAILAACQVKSTGKLYVGDGKGGSREINLNVVVGEKKVKEAEGTIYIYIGKEKIPLTQDVIEKEINEFCKKNSLGEGTPVWDDDQMGRVWNMKANVSGLNVAFQECVKNPDAFDKLVKEEVDSLKQFTDDERKEIAGLISKAVINPIKKAKNIWNIEGLTFMRNFTEACKDNKMKGAQGVMGVVRGIVKKQVDTNFRLRQNGSQCLLPVDMKVSAQQMVFSQYRSDSQGNWIEMEPREVIGTAITSNKGLLQVGGNNCFMVSIVNALLGNEKGRNILKNCFCNSDGNYHFKDGGNKELVITEAEVDKWAQKDQKLMDMSKLERVIWTAWLKSRFGAPEQYGFDGAELPGGQGTASDVAFLFGLSAHSEDVSIDGVSLTPSGLGKWVQVQKHLASGQFAVVHHGGADNGHYETITDVKSTGDGRSFGCCDSAGRDRSLALDRVQVESEIADPSKSQIILLTLPQDVA